MESQKEPGNIEVQQLYDKLRMEAKIGGYNLNPDETITRDLVSGLLVNEERYGYRACPCRLASGDRGHDRDIYCPCVYREPDVREYGGCYCNLYVSKEWNEEKIPHEYVPERRPPDKIMF